MLISIFCLLIQKVGSSAGKELNANQVVTRVISVSGNAGMVFV